MAARKHGRILASIWEDDDFRALDSSPQRMFLFLISQPDLEQSGVIPLRERRWSRAAADLKPGDVAADLEALRIANFVVIDEDTEELLVRSLIRRDGVWKQPNVFKSAADQIGSISSPLIKAALHDELARLELDGAHPDVRSLRSELVAYLEPFAKGSGRVREGFEESSHLRRGEGSSNGSSEEVSPSPFPLPPSSSEPASQPADVEPVREDVERLCNHLADRIEQNGSKRPTITRKWRDTARLLMDKDGRSEEQIHKAIDWCQDDSFWQSNVMSMPKLREKYDTLRLRAQAQRTPRASPNGGTAAPADIKPSEEWMYRR